MDWVRGQWLWIRPGQEPSGAIYVVRRKLGTAVKRNHLKRRLRCIYRQIAPLPHSLVVFPQPPAIHASFHQLTEELLELVTRLR